MISSLRNFAKTKLAGVFVGIIILPFVFWGMGDMFSSGNTNNVVKINEKSISTEEFIDYLNSSGIPEKTIRENLDQNIIEELLSGLVSTTFTKGEYEIQKGPKLTLSDKIFEYSLNDYWSKQTNQIITFEKLMYDYGSPGKVFQLDEKSMEHYLEKLEMDSKNFVFSKGAGGLRQITKVKEISENQLLKNCYKKVA